jgi:hypothetical protein
MVRTAPRSSRDAGLAVASLVISLSLVSIASSLEWGGAIASKKSNANAFYLPSTKRLPQTLPLPESRLEQNPKDQHM